MLKSIRNILRPNKEFYVVDIIDECVLYAGKYKHCEDVIDTLPGGFYAILNEKHLTDNEKDSLTWLTQP